MPTSIPESKVHSTYSYIFLHVCSYLACIIPCIFCDFVNGVIYIDTKVCTDFLIVFMYVCPSTNFPFSVFSLLYITLYRKWKYVDTREYRWGKNIHSVGLEISSQKIVAKSWQPKHFSPECILLWKLKAECTRGAP